MSFFFFIFLHELHDGFFFFFSLNAGSFGHLVQMHLKGFAAKDGKKLVQRIHFILTLNGEVRLQ